MKERKWITVKDLCKNIGGEHFTGGLIGMYHLNNEFYVNEEDLNSMKNEFDSYLENIDKSDKSLKLTSKNRFLSPLIQKLINENRVRPKKANSIKFITGE